jgi:hypothetical protein
MDLREIGWFDMDWIHIEVLVKTGMNLLVPYNRGKFFTS